MKDPRELTVGEVADAIGVRPVDWAGRCFEIASRMVEVGLVDGEAVYGHWTGPVHKNSRFSGQEGAGFVQHGWVLLADGYTVVDPTRWVFEASKPYIFVGEPPDSLEVICTCGHVIEEHDDGFFRECLICGDDCAGFDPDQEAWYYDEGGNQFRDMMRRPFPGWDETQREFEVDFGEARHVVLMMTQHAGPWTAEQLHWLATQPYHEYRGMAYEVYQGIISTGLAGFIPFDNRKRAEREHAAA